jgi:hypothetical protein
MANESDLPDEPDLEEEENIEEIAEEILQEQDWDWLPVEYVTESQRRLDESLYARLLRMKVRERLMLALKGNREVRAILIHDPNQIVQRFVLQNPRVTEEEVISFVNNRSADRDLLELVARNRQWTKNYQVRLGLVLNPKTPIVTAVQLTRSLNLRDLRQLARSKNVPIAVCDVAKRVVIQKVSGEKSG